METNLNSNPAPTKDSDWDIFLGSVLAVGIITACAFALVESESERLRWDGWQTKGSTLDQDKSDRLWAAEQEARIAYLRAQSNGSSDAPILRAQWQEALHAAKWHDMR